MNRRRFTTVGSVLLVVVVVAAGWWRRADLLDQRDVARMTRRTELQEITQTQRRIRATVMRASRIETDNSALRAAATELTATAEGIAHQVEGVQRERDDAALAAYYAGGRVAELRTCLDGIERALNQVSVGDPGAVGSLGLVRSACQAMGA